MSAEQHQRGKQQPQWRYSWKSAQVRHRSVSGAGDFPWQWAWSPSHHTIPALAVPSSLSHATRVRSLIFPGSSASRSSHNHRFDYSAPTTHYFFPCHQLLGLIVPKGRHWIFDMHNSLSASGKQEGETGTDECTSLPQKSWKTGLQPVSTGSWTHDSCLHLITRAAS